MPVTIHIPAPLREHADHQDRVMAEGGTVAAVLEELGRRFPALSDRLFEKPGCLRRFVNVYVNDEDIRYLNSLDTGLNPGDQVSIIPAVAGG